MAKGNFKIWRKKWFINDNSAVLFCFLFFFLSLFEFVGDCFGPQYFTSWAMLPQKKKNHLRFHTMTSKKMVRSHYCLSSIFLLLSQLPPWAQPDVVLSFFSFSILSLFLCQMKGCIFLNITPKFQLKIRYTSWQKMYQFTVYQVWFS